MTVLAGLEIPVGFPWESGHARRPAQRIDKHQSDLIDFFGEAALPRSGGHTESKRAITATGSPLVDARRDLKTRLSRVSMHLPEGWFDGLNHQLDLLLNDEDWDPDDIAPKSESFDTFLRVLMLLQPARRPGLAVGGRGHIAALWMSGNNRLTIQCLNNDNVRWVLAVEVEGRTEKAGGECVIFRLGDVLAPYQPERWFNAE